MTLDEEWVKETARLIREREHAQNMLVRWQTKLDEVNAVLAAKAAGETAQVQEQAAVPE